MDRVNEINMISRRIITTYLLFSTSRRVSKPSDFCFADLRRRLPVLKYFLICKGYEGKSGNDQNDHIWGFNTTKKA